MARLSVACRSLFWFLEVSICRSSAINQLLASIMPTPTAYSSIAAHHTGLFQRGIHGFSTVPDRFRRCFGYGQVDWGLLLRSFGGNGEAMKNFVFILFLSPPHLFRIASHRIASHRSRIKVDAVVGGAGLLSL